MALRKHRDAFYCAVFIAQSRRELFDVQRKAGHGWNKPGQNKHLLDGYLSLYIIYSAFIMTC